LFLRVKRGFVHVEQRERHKSAAVHHQSCRGGGDHGGSVNPARSGIQPRPGVTWRFRGAFDKTAGNSGKEKIPRLVYGYRPEEV
jgi:hypothetical protein